MPSQPSHLRLPLSQKTHSCRNRAKSSKLLQATTPWCPRVVTCKNNNWSKQRSKLQATHKATYHTWAQVESTH